MPKSVAVKKSKAAKSKPVKSKSKAAPKAAPAKSAAAKATAKQIQFKLAQAKLAQARTAKAKKLKAKTIRGRKGAKPGDLPVWDLSHLYPGPESAALKSDLTESQDRAKAFEARYAGKLASLGGKDFGVAIGEYETLQEVLGRIM
ncbi:MAG TPA: hypothetical protein VGO34_02720, partial [Alphaproteobacteria bacterium]